MMIPQRFATKKRFRGSQTIQPSFTNHHWATPKERYASLKGSKTEKKSAAVFEENQLLNWMVFFRKRLLFSSKGF